MASLNQVNKVVAFGNNGGEYTVNVAKLNVTFLERVKYKVKWFYSNEMNAGNISRKDSLLLYAHTINSILDKKSQIEYSYSLPKRLKSAIKRNEEVFYNGIQLFD